MPNSELNQIFIRSFIEWCNFLFGGKFGQKSGSEKSPTYVFPEELRGAIRRRFPNEAAGKRDEEYNNLEGVHMVSWEEMKTVKWPNPPKACKLCSAKLKKPY